MNDRRGVPWYAHPDRPCKDDPGYADLTMVPSRVDRIAMLRACASCPVFFECLRDLLRFPKSEHYGIRAGVLGLT